jgi:hypothetical protein
MPQDTDSVKRFLTNFWKVFLKPTISLALAVIGLQLTVAWSIISRCEKRLEELVDWSRNMWTGS